jgi:hypothetical protein
MCFNAIVIYDAGKNNILFWCFSHCARSIPFYLHFAKLEEQKIINLNAWRRVGESPVTGVLQVSQHRQVFLPL